MLGGGIARYEIENGAIDRERAFCLFGEKTDFYSSPVHPKIATSVESTFFAPYDDPTFGIKSSQIESKSLSQFHFYFCVFLSCFTSKRSQLNDRSEGFF